MVGKSTRSAAIPSGEPSVQRKASGAGGADSHAVAARGVEGAAAPYPHRATIEALFGQPVEARAALGGAAGAACDGLGAEAYARGDQVAFASGSPDLRLAAHEAAHTVQQRQGVQLDGGFGRAGDAHEQVADEAADRVTRGVSAADLFGGGRGAPSTGVQLQQRADAGGGGGEPWRAVLAAIAALPAGGLAELARAR